MTRTAKLLMEKMEVQAKFPYLLEVTYYDNQGNSEIYRYVNSDEDKTFEGNTYSAGFFKLSLPERNSSGFSDASITFSAIDQEWVQKIRSTNQRCKVRFVAVIEYYSGQETIEPIEDMEFILTNAIVKESVIQFTIKFDDLLDLKVPYDECNDRVCPALV